MGSVVTVEVEELEVAGVSLGFGCPGTDVGPFFEKDPVEPFNFAVGLWPPHSGLLDDGAGLGTCPMPQP